MAKQTDVSLVVVATGITSRASLRRTQEQLTRAGVEQLGIVLNDVSREIREVAPAYGYAPSSPKRQVDDRKREVSSAKRVHANGSSANGSSDNGSSDNGSSDMTENQVDSVTASSMTNRYED